MRGWATIMVLTGAAALVAAAAAPERVVEGDGVVSGTLAGVPARLRIDPAGTSMPIVTAALATRAGLKSGMFAIRYGIGPQRVSGRTAVTMLNLGGAPFKRRVAWAEPAFTPAADGVIGPGGLPDPVVRFRLREALPGERSVSLPMMDQGGIAAGWGELYARIEVGGQPMRVRFDPHHPRTLASAAAAARIAQAQGGTLSGETAPVEIAFGISRPVRTLRLARPLSVGELTLATMGARVADSDATAGIREEGADPDEVVVVAGKKRDPGRDRLSLGADVLARCSTITYDKPARQIRLTCVPGGL